MKKIYVFLICILFAGMIAEAQQQPPRLLGLTKTKYGNGAFNVQDSSYYMYSGTEDTTNTGALAYDSSYTLAYTAGLTINNNSYRYYQSFDGNNNDTAILTQYYDSSVASWFNYQHAHATYNADSNITYRLIQNWDIVNNVWVDSTQTFYTYAGHNLVTKVNMLWNAPLANFINNTNDSFGYDGSNNETYHLSQTWDTGANSWKNITQYMYTFNTPANGLVDTTIRQVWDTIAAADVWINYTEMTYGYNTNNLVSQHYTQNWDTVNNVWANYRQDTSVYDAANNKIMETILTWDSIAYVNTNVNLYTYDGNHDMLTDTTKNWSNTNMVFTNNKLKIYIYNAFDEVLVYTTESWSNNLQAWHEGNADVQYRYYYEDSSTEIKNVTIAANNMSVYPLPAQTMLNVKLSWNEPQAFTMGIYDMQGRLLKQWSVAATQQYQQRISLTDIPAGSYFITATGAKQQMTKQIVITE